MCSRSSSGSACLTRLFSHASALIARSGASWEAGSVESVGALPYRCRCPQTNTPLVAGPHRVGPQAHCQHAAAQGQVRGAEAPAAHLDPAPLVDLAGDVADAPEGLGGQSE